MYQKFRMNNKGVVSNQEEPVFKFHLEHFDPQSKFWDKDFIPMFKAERFNPDVTPR